MVGGWGGRRGRVGSAQKTVFREAAALDKGPGFLRQSRWLVGRLAQGGVPGPFTQCISFFTQYAEQKEGITIANVIETRGAGMHVTPAARFHRSAGDRKPSTRRPPWPGGFGWFGRQRSWCRTAPSRPHRRSCGKCRKGRPRSRLDLP